jgi:hypothetical protein
LVSVPWGVSPSKSDSVPRGGTDVTVETAASRRVGVDFGVFKPGD